MSEQNNLWLNRLPTFIRDRLEGRPGLLRVVSNIGWSLVDRVLRMAIGLFIGIWIARYLGPENFGILSYALTYVALFGSVVTLGLKDIAIRDLVKAEQETDLTLGTMFLLQLVAGLCTYGIALALIFQLRAGDSQMFAMVGILGVALIFQATEFVRCCFDSRLQARYVVWVDSSALLAFAAVKAGLILLGFPMIYLVWALFAESFAVSLGLLAMYQLRGGTLLNLRFQLRRARLLLSDSWPLLVSSMSILVYMRIDQIMIGHMLGNESVGIYAAAVRISEAWYFIPMIVAGSVFPPLLKIKSESQSKYLAKVQLLYDSLSALSFSVAIVTTFLGSWLINLLYGEVYAEAGVVLSLQIWAGIFVALGVARGKWLLAEGLQYMGYWYITIAMIVNIVGNLILIPSMGIIGATVATLLAQATATFFAPAIFKKSRPSVYMLLRSLNPLRWLGLVVRG